MTWNWQKKEWPAFIFDAGRLDDLERAFLKASGVLEGVYRHLIHDRVPDRESQAV